MPRFARGGEDVDDWEPVADSKGEIKTLGEIKYNKEYYNEIYELVEEWEYCIDEDFWINIGAESVADYDLGELQCEGTPIPSDNVKCATCKKEFPTWLVSVGSEGPRESGVCAWCYQRQKIKDSEDTIDSAFGFHHSTLIPSAEERTRTIYEIQKEEEFKIDAVANISKLQATWELNGLFSKGYVSLINKNARIKREMEKELITIVDDPHKLLGKLCIRMDAMELNDEWVASDFPNIPSYD